MATSHRTTLCSQSRRRAVEEPTSLPQGIFDHIGRVLASDGGSNSQGTGECISRGSTNSRDRWLIPCTSCREPPTCPLRAWSEGRGAPGSDVKHVDLPPGPPRRVSCRQRKGVPHGGAARHGPRSRRLKIQWQLVVSSSGCLVFSDGTARHAASSASDQSSGTLLHRMERRI